MDNQSKRQQIEAFVNEIPATLRRKKAESTAKLTPPKNDDQFLDFMPGRQLDIVYAILGAIPNAEEGWLTANRQVELLALAQNAKRSDGQPAFPVMAKWDGKKKAVPLQKLVKEQKALRMELDRRRVGFKLAPGVTPADIGVSQLVVDALAKHEVIPWYDINKV